MRVIQTKSFLEPKTRADGIRISVMRRHKPEYDFDIWLPKLAPSERLLKAYVKEKTMGWEEFASEYKRKILAKNMKYIKLIVAMAELSPVSILCWEEDAAYCHRSLVEAACLELARKKHGPKT